MSRSAVTDGEHLLNAVRYVSLNPVRAGLVERAEQWPWSSAAAHLAGQDDELVKVQPVLERYGDFSALLTKQQDNGYLPLRQSEMMGRPLGSTEWTEQLERQTGKTFRPRKRGPKPASQSSRLVTCI